MTGRTTEHLARSLAPLDRFVADMTALVASSPDEKVVIAEGKKHLARLVSTDAWLPENCAASRPDRYAQYLLYCDPLERFSIVSFVWGPGQTTAVHDHTVWGLVGVLRGAEQCDEFELRDGVVRDLGDSHVMTAGQVEAVSPTIGDWHRVGNCSDGVSVSIHVYGGNIGAIRRHRLGDDGQIVDFVSGYDNAAGPLSAASR